MSGVVVFGTGFGCVTHVRELRAAGFEVMALAGQDPVETAFRADLFDIPRALTSVDEALAVEGVDAVSIATPPHTHAVIALAAAEAAGVVHLLGCEFRWDAGQALLAQTVSSGEIGEPRLATVVLHVPLLADPAAVVPGWWADVDRGGGWMAAHGSQIIDQIRCTLGEFDRVSTSLPRIAARTCRPTTPSWCTSPCGPGP